MSLFEPAKKKIFKRIESSADGEEKKAHRDYERNLAMAENFIKTTERNWKEGVSVRLTGSQELPKSIVYICFSPPVEYPMGNYAIPIFLHGEYAEVTGKIINCFNAYQKKAAEVAIKIKEKYGR